MYAMRITDEAGAVRRGVKNLKRDVKKLIAGGEPKRSNPLDYEVLHVLNRRR
jgi:hypothetical protein